MDVGGAGAFGFDYAKPPFRSKLSFPLEEIQYVQGGHGAAIGEKFWPQIAAFVLSGKAPCTREEDRVGWLKGLYRVAPAFTVAGGTVLAALLTAPLTAPIWTSVQLGVSAEITMLTVVAVLAGLGVSWIAVRFLRAW